MGPCPGAGPLLHRRSVLAPGSRREDAGERAGQSAASRELRPGAGPAAPPEADLVSRPEVVSSSGVLGLEAVLLLFARGILDRVIG